MRGLKRRFPPDGRSHLKLLFALSARFPTDLRPTACAGEKLYLTTRSTAFAKCKRCDCTTAREDTAK
jgi:hypothetical protein